LRKLSATKSFFAALRDYYKARAEVADMDDLRGAFIAGRGRTNAPSVVPLIAAFQQAWWTKTSGADANWLKNWVAVKTKR